MDTAEPDRLTETRRLIAYRLRIDAATAEVVRAFDQTGVRTLLLKGASFHAWLYGVGEARFYSDADLLVAPGDRERAGAALRSLGFVPELEEEQMPVWWREHGLAWARAEDGAVVDLHRSLPGVGAEDEVLWEILDRGGEVLEVGGHSIRALSIPARAVHLALHGAQHGPESPLVLQDLRLALKRVGVATWEQAAQLAGSLEATSAFAVGLRMVPAGEAMAEHLGLSHDRGAGVALRSAGAPAPALTVERLSSAGGMGAKAAIVWHKLAPPPTYMRRWFPRARGSRFWLVIGYVWRPIWVLAQAPSAYRAHRRARRPSRH